MYGRSSCRENFWIKLIMKANTDTTNHQIEKSKFCTPSNTCLTGCSRSTAFILCSYCMLKEPWTVRCWRDMKMIFSNFCYSSSCALPIHFVRGWGRNIYNPETAKGGFGMELDWTLSESPLWICSNTPGPHTHLPSRQMQQHSCSELLGYTESFALHSAPQTRKKHSRGRAGHTRLGCGVKWPNRALRAELTQLPQQHQRVHSTPGAFPALWNHTDSG